MIAARQKITTSGDNNSPPLDKTKSSNPFRVLIMERDERVSRVLGRIIDKMGHIPATAADLEQFKRLYGELNPDLILLSLDVEDGDAVNADFLRYLAEQKAQAIICLLGSIDDDHFEGLVQLGLSARLKIGGMFRKPLDVDTLKSKLIELMRVEPDHDLKKKLTASRILPILTNPSKPMVFNEAISTN